MANKYIAASAADVAALRELLTSYRNGELRSRSGSAPSIQQPDEVLVGKAAATIAAATSTGATNVSNGTINIYTFGNSTLAGQGVMTAANWTLTAHNLSTVEVTTEQWVQVRRHYTGNYVISDSWIHTRKPIIEVTADSSFTNSSSSFSATIVNQYGPGINNSTASSVTCRNFSVGGSSYLFNGNSGNSFIALWDSGTTYEVIQGECT